MTIDEFRKMALEIPTAVERSHMHHPDFRVGGKIFALLGVPDKNWGMVKLTPEQQRTLIRKAPKVFKPCSGTWGRLGYTNVYLASAKTRVVRNAPNAAAKNVSSLAKKSSRSRGRTLQHARRVRSPEQRKN
jgi:YjbR protein